MLLPAASKALEIFDEDDFEYIYSSSTSKFSVVEFVKIVSNPVLWVTSNLSNSFIL
jgi:hypothetical protein